jgi:hypothetical protein
MKKLLTSIVTVLAISSNAFAAQGDADALAGLVFGIIGLIIAVYAGFIFLSLLVMVLYVLVIGIAAVINTVIILPIVFLINKIFGKFYEYFYFTKWTKNKMADLLNSIG